jgi:hypothetical protein
MVTDVPQEERAQIDAVEHRLAQKYAELPHAHVAGVVGHAYARFDQSKLRDFVPLLVERRAGEQLALSTAAQQAVAKSVGAVEDSEIADVRDVASRNGARRRALTRWRLSLGILRG